MSSSDLETVRAIVRRLGGAAGAPSAAPSPFVRLPAAGSATTPTSWSAALDRCLAATSGEGVLVLDREGLLVMTAGAWSRWTHEQIDSVAARLSAALGQCLLVETPPGCGPGAIAIALGDRWLSGVRVARGEGEFTVAFLSTSPPSAGATRQVDEEIGRVLESYRTPPVSGGDDEGDAR